MKRYISLVLIIIMLFSLLGCTASPEELVDNAKSEISESIDEVVDEAVDDVKQEANNWKEKNITQPLNNTKNSIIGFFSALFNHRPKLVEDTSNNIVTVYNSKGEEIIEPDIDTIAKAKYKKKFKSCKKEQRTDVIRLFMINRGVPSVVVDFMSEIDTSKSSIPLKKWEKFEKVIATAGTDFAILELYANVKGDGTAEKAFGVLGRGGEIVENINSIVKSIFLFKGLANNDLKDSPEYCMQLIEAIGSVSDIVGIEYFSESLETVKVGVEVLLEQYEKREHMYEAIDVAIFGDESNSTVRKDSGILSSPRWCRITADSSTWDDEDNEFSHKVTLEDIKENHADLIAITDEERIIIERYIIFLLNDKLN